MNRKIQIYQHGARFWYCPSYEMGGRIWHSRMLVEFETAFDAACHARQNDYADSIACDEALRSVRKVA